MLPEVLSEVHQLVGDRRVTVVFDRGGNADGRNMPTPADSAGLIPWDPLFAAPCELA